MTHDENADTHNADTRDTEAHEYGDAADRRLDELPTDQALALLLDRAMDKEHLAEKWAASSEAALLSANEIRQRIFQRLIPLKRPRILTTTRGEFRVLIFSGTLVVEPVVEANPTHESEAIPCD